MAKTLLRPSTVGIVPARSGSSGISHKNLAGVGGVSLLERAIRCSQNVPEISSTIVSSDSPIYLHLATTAGADVHHRTERNSTDTARADDVLREVIEHYGWGPNTICVYLQPTSPFRLSLSVSSALRLFDSTGRPVVSVQRLTQLPGKSLRVGEQGLLESYLSEGDPSGNRQNHPGGVYPNGAIYVFSVEQFWKHGVPIHGAAPFFMNSFESIDIDSQEDLDFANKISSCVEKVLK